MNSTAFVALQSVATVALAAAAEQFAAHNYLVAIGCAVVGIVAYAAYELIPQKTV